MNNKENGLLKFLSVASDLQITPRWEGRVNWSGIGKDRHPEMVSDHSWKLSLLVISVVKEYNLTHVDLGRAVQLATVHDLAEAVTGDISARFVDVAGYITKEQKNINENIAMEDMLSNTSDGTNGYIKSLWLEYEACESPEAVLVKCLDKLDPLIHFINYTEISDSSLNEGIVHFGSYGNKFFKKCPELKSLIDVVKSDMKKKYIDNGVAWLDGNDIDW